MPRIRLQQIEVLLRDEARKSGATIWAPDCLIYFHDALMVSIGRGRDARKMRRLLRRSRR